VRPVAGREVGFVEATVRRPRSSGDWQGHRQANPAPGGTPGFHAGWGTGARHLRAGEGRRSSEVQAHRHLHQRHELRGPPGARPPGHRPWSNPVCRRHPFEESGDPVRVMDGAPISDGHKQKIYHPDA